MRRTSALWWVPVLALAAVLAWFDAGRDGGDLPFFVDAGRTLLSGGWSATYADPDLQAGPLLLALLGLIDLAAEAVSVPTLALLAFLLEIGGAVAFVCVLRRVSPDVRRGTAAAAGVLAIAVGVVGGAFVDGHPAQLAIPLLWLLAADQARRGRAGVAGVIVGAAAGLELWGLLGVVVLAFAPRFVRSLAVGGSSAALAAGALLAPFILLGEFRMLDYSWRVADGTVAGFVLGAGSEYPWSLRLLQAAAAVAAGFALAHALRRSVHGPWVALFGLVLVRVVLDPVLYSWYLLPLQALAIVGLAVAVSTPAAGARVAARFWRNESVPIEAP